MNIEQIAKTCHEVNRAYCASIGDFSQPEWKNAPQWQKESAINGVKFHLANPQSRPWHSHNSWMDEKIKAGWKFGEVKNPDTKEHPCIVPYAELPKEQQAKDVLFIAVVRSFEKEVKPDQDSVKTSFDIEVKIHALNTARGYSTDVGDLTKNAKIILDFLGRVNP